MVKLYDCVITGGMKEQAVGEPGDWVDYDDYAALQAENERLKAERVDLEQFRNAVMFHLSDAQQSSEVEDGERLLALIDAQKEG